MTENERKPPPLISFHLGADPESEKWDNRKPMPVYTFDTAEHEEILLYLRGFY